MTNRKPKNRPTTASRTQEENLAAKRHRQCCITAKEWAQGLFDQEPPKAIVVADWLRQGLPADCVVTYTDRAALLLPPSLNFTRIPVFSGRGWVVVYGEGSRVLMTSSSEYRRLVIDGKAPSTSTGRPPLIKSSFKDALVARAVLSDQEKNEILFFHPEGHGGPRQSLIGPDSAACIDKSSP